MKSIFKACGLCAIVTFAAMSCNNSTKQENAQVQDSAEMQRLEAAKADSLAKVAAAQAEAARIDSLRQDSIQKAEKAAEFANHLPDGKKLGSQNGAGMARYLKSLGFKGSYQNLGNEFDEASKGSFSFASEDKKCSVSWDQDFNLSTIRVTITGDAEALQKFYNQAKKLITRYGEGGTDVSLKGNTVVIESFGA